MISLEPHNTPGVKGGQEGDDGPEVIIHCQVTAKPACCLAPSLGLFLPFSALSLDPMYFTLPA